MDSLAVYLKDAAKETNPDKVDANTRACRAYGRDCPARSVCRAAMHNSLASFVGVTAAENLLIPFGKKPTQLVGDSLDMTIAPTSIVARLAAQKAAQEAGQAAAPAAKPAALQGLTQTSTLSPDVQAEMARLQAQEQALTAKPAPIDVLALVKEIESYGLGFPELVGAAAATFASLTGLTPSSRDDGHYIPGAGALGGDKIDQVDLLPAVLAQVKEYAAANNITPKGDPAPPALLPPDAPPSNPLLASRGPEAPPAEKKKPGRPKKDKTTTVVSTTMSTTIGPNETGDVVIAPPTQSTTKALEITQVEEETTSDNVVTTTPDIAQSRFASAEAQDSTAPAPAPYVDPRIYFYVNCSPEGVPSTSFWTIVYELTSILSKQLEVPDFRLSEKMAYNKWKPTIAAYLREANNLGKIPAGHYVFDNAGTELGQVVLETMREIVQMSNGVLVQGTR